MIAPRAVVDRPRPPPTSQISGESVFMQASSTSLAFADWASWSIPEWISGWVSAPPPRPATDPRATRRQLVIDTDTTAGARQSERKAGAKERASQEISKHGVDLAARNQTAEMSASEGQRPRYGRGRRRLHGASGTHHRLAIAVSATTLESVAIGLEPGSRTAARSRTRCEDRQGRLRGCIVIRSASL